MKFLFGAEKLNTEVYVRVILISAIPWWHVLGGRATHVDLGLTAVVTGPHDGGAGKAADARGGPEVGEYAFEDLTINNITCREQLRQIAERAGNTGRLRRYLV